MRRQGPLTGGESLGVRTSLVSYNMPLVALLSHLSCLILGLHLSLPVLRDSASLLRLPPKASVEKKRHTENIFRQ